MSDAAACSPAVPLTSREKISAYIALLKPRIACLVLVTTAVGYFAALSEPIGSAALLTLFHVIFGTALIAGGANAINQYLEVDYDRLMHRTARRPLPAGVLSGTEALAFGLGTAVLGSLYLVIQVNLLAACLATTTFGVYVALYTPLKRLTPLAVHIGAVAGALPPLIGWSGAVTNLPLEAWSLFAILYFWQLPHFAAIAWQYREDYARAGFAMLPVIDPQGMRLGSHVVHHTLGLLIASLLPVGFHLAGIVYAVLAILLGIGFLYSGIRFLRVRTERSARLHVISSIIYLPTLLVALLIDKLPR